MIQYLSIFLFLFSTAVSYGQIINRGPYLQVLSPESIQICWRTDVPTTSRNLHRKLSTLSAGTYLVSLHVGKQVQTLHVTKN